MPTKQQMLDAVNQAIYDITLEQVSEKEVTTGEGKGQRLSNLSLAELSSLRDKLQFEIFTENSSGIRQSTAYAKFASRGKFV